MRTMVACIAVLLWGIGLVPSVAATETNSSQTPAQNPTKTDRTIGECHLVNSINPLRTFRPESPIYSVNPIETVNAYFVIIEKRDVGLEGRTTLLHGPEHGAVKEEWNQNYRYIPNPDYLGSDQASFLVEIGGLKIKAVYHFKVIDGGAIGGTEDNDKVNCPKGMFWKISANK